VQNKVLFQYVFYVPAVVLRPPCNACRSAALCIREDVAISINHRGNKKRHQPIKVTVTSLEKLIEK